MEEKDLEFLREQLSRLDEPELPPSLTAAALFARMDEGNLTLPEEEPAKEERKVIPWGRIIRRWAPLAACLVLVLLLYQGYEVGLARNFSNDAAPQLTANGVPEPAAAAPHTPEAAYDTDAASEEESAEENGLLRMAENAPAEMAEDSDGLQKSAGTSAVGAAPAPPAPAPAPSGRPDTGGSDSSAESSRPNPDGSNSSGGNSSSKPNPDTGGSNNPDSGGPLYPVRPPDFSQDSGADGPSLYKLIKAQMEEIAAENIPVGAVSSRTVNMSVNDNDQLVFEAVYADENRVIQARARFYCWYYEGKGEAWLEVQTFKWIDP